MNDTQSTIERVVMRRVRLMRILGLVISTAVFAILALVFGLWGIGKEVWVARVFENAPPDIGDLLNFYIAAFFHTNLVVQALIVLTFASLIFLARETIRLVVDTFSTPAS